MGRHRCDRYVGAGDDLRQKLNHVQAQQRARRSTARNRAPQTQNRRIRSTAQSSRLLDSAPTPPRSDTGTIPEHVAETGDGDLEHISVVGEGKGFSAFVARDSEDRWRVLL